MNRSRLLTCCAASLALFPTLLAAQISPVVQRRTMYDTVNCGTQDFHILSAPGFGDFNEYLDATCGSSTPYGVASTRQASAIRPTSILGTLSSGIFSRQAGASVLNYCRVTFTVPDGMVYSFTCHETTPDPQQTFYTNCSLTGPNGAVFAASVLNTARDFTRSGALPAGQYEIDITQSYGTGGGLDVDITAAANFSLVVTRDDSCNNPASISGYGRFAFDTTSAATDGSGAVRCNAFGADQIENDMWYRWTAPRDQQVELSTCGLTDMDSKVAVYAGSACPGSAEPLVCNDDACGVQSTVSFHAAAGRQYLIRLGNYPSAGGGTGRFSITPVRPTVVQGPVWNPANRHTYYLLSPSTWATAEMEAKVLGGHLVTINNAAENAFVRTTFGAPSDMWIGLNDTQTEGTFTWASGDPASFRRWQAGQPDDFLGDEDGVHMTADGSWNDNSENALFSAVVEVATPVIIGGPVTNPANGHVYVALSHSSWTQEEAAATGLDGHLVTINDAAENAFVRSFVDSLPGIAGTKFFIGLSDQAVEGTFVWSSGQPVGYTNWAPGQPNTSNPNTDYAEVAANGQWGTTTDASADPSVGVAEIEVPPVQAGPFRRPDSCHAYFMLAPSTWQRAQMKARALGGNLASVNDAAENDFIVNTILTRPEAGHRFVWLGFTDQANEGVYTWVDGSVTDYTNWGPSEPTYGVDNFAALSPGYPTAPLGMWFSYWTDAGPATFGLVEVTNPACPCDWNFDGRTNSQDFFDFLTAFFSTSADFNCSGSTNSQDYFDFVTCFFSGC
jgi:hypothetical protein